MFPQNFKVKMEGYFVYEGKLDKDAKYWIRH